MKKYFLTTALMGTFIVPAFGADGTITGGAGTCTVEVLGVHENNAIANTIATWTLNKYTLVPGKRLNVTDTDVETVDCDSGSYCPGGEYTVETASEATKSCPADFPNSETGAGADTQCYTACTVDMVAKATKVTGNDYYGTGTDTCGATACETGYHVDGGGIELVEKTPLVPISLTAEGAGYRYVLADGRSVSGGTLDAIPADSVTAPNTWAMAYSEGTVYGKASCQSATDPASVYFFSNFDAVASGTMSMEEFRTGALAVTTEDKADVIVDLAKAYSVMVTGQGDMTEAEIGEAFAKYFVTFSESSDKNYSTDSVGQYCYCQMDGFTPTGGTKEIVTSAPWVFDAGYVYGSADSCADRCVLNCANDLRNNGDVFSLAFRGAVFGAFDLVESGGICAANTINIDWNPDNNGAHINNMCTYDGSITVPSDPVKPGYTFTGWKLVE